MAATLDALTARVAPWLTRRPPSADASDASCDTDIALDTSSTSSSEDGRLLVSVVDVEYEGAGGRVSGSLFYPAQPNGGSAPPRWAPHYYYTYGMADFALRRRPKSRATRAAAAVMAAVAHLPARSLRLPVCAAAAPPARGGFPTVIFSHGLGGSRHAYSAFCAGLAARGFAVLAVEHADGSAAAARFAGEWLPYERWDTAPDSDQLTRRMATRAGELGAAAAVLAALAAGTPVHGLVVGGAGRGGDTLFPLFAAALASTPPLLAGHSLGGATVAAAVATGAPAVVALDPWWGAVPTKKGDEVETDAKIPPAPLLVIASEEWQRPLASLGGACFAGSPDAALAAATASPGARGAVWLALRGATHACFSDFCARPPRVPGLPPPPPPGLTAPTDGAATVAAAVEAAARFFEACGGDSRQIVTAAVAAAVVDAVGEERVDGLRVVGGRRGAA